MVLVRRDKKHPLQWERRTAAAETPDLSQDVAVGKMLRTRLEAAIGDEIVVNNCLQYLTALDSMQILDCDEIVEELTVYVPRLPHIQAKYDTQQKYQDWLRLIVETALVEWIASTT